MVKIKILLAALNSKFIHSSLAVRSLFSYCNEYSSNLLFREFTINNSEDFILSEIYKLNPDIIGFSCYIWNIEAIKNICSLIKKVKKDIIIILGGPEVSYEIDKENPNWDIIVKGEGEETFKQLADCFINKKDFRQINGIAYRENGDIIETGNGISPDLDDIPFPYRDLSQFENKILYYESSRGCPFNCQYCLSSVEKGVRFLSAERVQKDLDFFLNHKPRQVKFVDRTFNCNKNHAFFIWQYLINHDNNYTNFHFEISADLLDEEMLSLLQSARPGLFQLEIGIQSTNPETLQDIKRKTQTEKIFEKVKEIKKYNNIHQHVDLIVGLPKEGYNSFKHSFNEVYALKADMLQIGFLKLLKGSGLRINAKALGMEFKDKAPYEVLYTKELSFDEILKLKAIEDLFETYYNSGKFKHILEYAVNFADTPFDFYEKFTQYWENQGLHLLSHSKLALFNIIFEFLKGINSLNIDFAKDLLKFDMFLNENTKNLPDWSPKTDYKKLKERLDIFYKNTENSQYFQSVKEYNPRQISKMFHIEMFHHNILTFMETGAIVKEETFILFNYQERDLLSNNAKYNQIYL